MERSDGRSALANGSLAAQLCAALLLAPGTALANDGAGSSAGILGVVTVVLGYLLFYGVGLVAAIRSLMRPPLKPRAPGPRAGWVFIGLSLVASALMPAVAVRGAGNPEGLFQSLVAAPYILTAAYWVAAGLLARRPPRRR